MKFFSASLALAALSALPAILAGSIEPITIKVTAPTNVELEDHVKLISLFREQNSFIQMALNSTLSG